MKFSDFLSPKSQNSDGDFAVINQTLQEAELCEQLRYAAVWPAEHHFDGGCAYVDPVVFASAIATRTQRKKFASPWLKWHCNIPSGSRDK